MESINNIKDISLNSLNRIVDQLTGGILNVFGVLLILLAGWFLINLLSKILLRILKAATVDRISDKINESKLFGDSQFKLDLSAIILSFFKAVMYLVVFTIAADIMDLPIISQEIGKLLSYLPRLFSAIAIFLVGLYIAGLIKKGMSGFLISAGFSGAILISNIVFFIVLTLFIITALNQADVNTELISNNLSFVVVACLLIIVVAVGIGSIEVVQKMMVAHYTRKNFNSGDYVIIDQTDQKIEGRIVKIEDLYVTIQSESQQILIPIKEFSNSKIRRV